MERMRFCRGVLHTPKDVCNTSLHMYRVIKHCLFGMVIYLTACTTRPPELVFPEQLNFQGKTYQKVTDNQINQLRQSLYLPSDSKKDPDDWQTAILLFSDQNKDNKTLEQRLAYRKETVVNMPETQIDYQITQGELRSQAIYPPSGRFLDVQLEATRGRNLSCGYGQMQVAEKHIFALLCQNLTHCYGEQLQQLVDQFNQLDWQMECR